MSKFKAAIFDLDGTLLYTLEDLASSLNQALESEGLPVHPTEHYRFMVGNGLETLVVRALPQALRQPFYVKPLLNKFIAIYRERQCLSTRPYGGIKNLLTKLKELKMPLAVLSNKAHPNTLEVVEHFFPETFFPVFGMRPDVPPKPSPAGALEIAGIWDLDPKFIVYLGDSDVDMETASAAKMFPVGAAWGYRPIEELKKAGAELTIEEPLQLLALFS